MRRAAILAKEAVWGLFATGIVTLGLGVAVEAAAGYLLRHSLGGVRRRPLDDTQLGALYPGWIPADVRQLLLEHGRPEAFAYTPFVEFTHREFHGRFVNVQRQGYRAPRPLPWPPPPGSVFLFGGSTTFGVGVDDASTLGAFLQSELGSETALYNFGTPAHFSTPERALFFSLVNQGLRPRAAVFVDGLNDFYFYDVPDRSLLSNRLQLAATAEAGFLARRLLTDLRTTQLLFALSGRDARELLVRPIASEPEIRKALGRMLSNREIVGSYCRAAGVRCLFVTHPVPTFAYDNSRRPVQADLDQVLNRAARNCRLGYELLEREESILAADDRLFLARLAVPEPMYVDAFHFSPALGRALAARIAGSLNGPARLAPPASFPALAPADRPSAGGRAH